MALESEGPGMGYSSHNTQNCYEGTRPRKLVPALRTCVLLPCTQTKGVSTAFRRNREKLVPPDSNYHGQQIDLQMLV
jgi:hypothetical protein